MRGLFFILLVFSLLGCSTQQSETLILVSKDNHQNIKIWLTNLYPGIVVKEAYKLSFDSVTYYLEIADGVVIGGGEDVYPLWYNEPEYIEFCGEFDHYRDSLEMIMIHYAMEEKVPLLGICRGQQIINVANGGTLIPDLPTFINSPIRHSIKTEYAHFVTPTENSWLQAIVGSDSLQVNSRHHQALAEVAPGFAVAAYAYDNVIESIEIKDQTVHPFAKAIQWHPEGLRDSVSNLIGYTFIDAVIAFDETH
jgi:gamma-glutamyl-gamma-aminobutyrate hydrolase PuuD